jgi:hypothetical protein
MSAAMQKVALEEILNKTIGMETQARSELVVSNFRGPVQERDIGLVT